MSSLKKMMIGFALLLIIVAGMLAVWWDNKTDEMYQDSFQSSYNYEVSIRTNETLDNVTLYLPLPVLEGSSSIGEEMVTRDFYNKAPGWNFSIADTQYGPMLSIEAEKLIPKYRSPPVPLDDEDIEPAEAVVTESDRYSEETPILMPFDFSIIVMTNNTINTKEPVGNEPVLQPKINLTESDDEDRVQPPENINPQYYDYEGRIYAQYETLPDTNVEIHVSMYGTNEGWVLGWTSNDYRDSMGTTLTGSRDGWVPVTGYLVTGDGVYKD
ncbi:hypothetical protein [Methanolobus halotolerans]|uniref:Uncharacterized protein n=1 Tax=Methanolobus halotolerans TaxID=2052935 RepID=A0A4E0PUA9_9EURY|nr:hypothetical protein [Methanolobus halotolerans]TGC06742.1 hypothetical protein CUN85_12700 [Methanolobus halotolerans]